MRANLRILWSAECLDFNSCHYSDLSGTATLERPGYPLRRRINCLFNNEYKGNAIATRGSKGMKSERLLVPENQVKSGICFHVFRRQLSNI